MDGAVGIGYDSVHIESGLSKLRLGADTQVPEGLEDSRVAGFSLLEKVRCSHTVATVQVEGVMGPDGELLQALDLSLLLLGGRSSLLDGINIESARL